MYSKTVAIQILLDKHYNINKDIFDIRYDTFHHDSLSSLTFINVDVKV
jgi:hypothetical protein